jgi:hypothetical protein
MAADLLSTIRHEIDERLSELRPLLGEHERLLAAVDVLDASGAPGDMDTVSVPDVLKPDVSKPDVSIEPRPAKSLPAKPARRRARPAAPRGSAAGAIEPAATGPVDASTEEPKVNEPAVKARRVEPAVKDKPQRAARGVARETILAALDHGSHTVSELAVVTAMSASNINATVRKLVAEGAIVKTEREGKAAWALPEAA